MERIKSVATNLLTDLTEDSRQGPTIVGCLAVLATCPETNNNDVSIGIFKQKAVLKRVLTQIKNGDQRSVIEQFERLRFYLLGDLKRMFLQFSYPFGCESQAHNFLNGFFDSWKNKFSPLVFDNSLLNNNNNGVHQRQPKKLKLDPEQFGVLQPVVAVENFLNSIQNDVARVLNTDKNYAVAIAGVETSFL